MKNLIKDIKKYGFCIAVGTRYQLFKWKTETDLLLLKEKIKSGVK